MVVIKYHDTEDKNYAPLNERPRVTTKHRFTMSGEGADEIARQLGLPRGLRSMTKEAWALSNNKKKKALKLGAIYTPPK